MPLSFTTLPADCIEKVVSTKSGQILHRRIPTPRPRPKMVLKGAWQLQQQSSIEKSIAVQDNPFNIDLRMQGVPHKAVLEDKVRTKRILRLARYSLKTCSRMESLIKGIHKTKVFNTFSDESKRTIHNLGKIELFELGEVSSKTQCPSCAKCWPEGILHCSCGQCLLPSDKQRPKTKE